MTKFEMLQEIIKGTSFEIHPHEIELHKINERNETGLKLFFYRDKQEIGFYVDQNDTFHNMKEKAAEKIILAGLLNIHV